MFVHSDFVLLAPITVFCFAFVHISLYSAFVPSLYHCLYLVLGTMKFGGMVDVTYCAVEGSRFLVTAVLLLKNRLGLGPAIINNGVYEVIHQLDSTVWPIS